jgi:two-component system KDP operon response regulator KdpE
MSEARPPAPVVLIVEDEPHIRRFVRAALESEQCQVGEAPNAARGLIEAGTRKPDLVLIDLGLPDGNGVDMIRELRMWSAVPVLVLSARSDEADKVAALDAGADDYLTKPFSMEELLARVRANLRRVRAKETLADDRTIEIGDLIIEPKSLRAFVAGQHVRLRLKEFQLLIALARRQGQLATRQILAEEVWGYEHLASSRTIDVHVRRLRQAVEEPSAYVYVHTVHGMGYRFEPVLKSETGQDGVCR